MCRRIIVQLYNNQTKSENHEICRDINISYVEVVKKKMRMFRTSYHIHCLQNEESPKKFHRVKKGLFQISSQSDDQIIV